MLCVMRRNVCQLRETISDEVMGCLQEMQQYWETSEAEATVGGRF